MGAGNPGEITCLAWNRKVQHILASGSSAGNTVVWDLKKQKPVITFCDPNLRRRNSCIVWNPEVATQLIVASDDDRCPTLQLWDLRNSTSPLKELVGHTKGVLAMEAMWTRYLPQFDTARQVIEQNLIGEVDLVVASFCYDLRHVKRLWAKNQGSPIYDIGIYPIAFAQMFLGNPDSIEAIGQLTDEGIDAETQIILRYNSGARARLFVSGIASTPVRAAVSGSKNTMEFGAPFFTPTSVSLVGRDVYLENDAWVDNTGVVGHEGLSYTATAFAKYVGEGLLESQLQSHADSVANIRVCEEIIRQLGADVY